jgi:hypothetical protein
MTTRLSDTAPEAERVLIDVYRRMPFERKWKIIGDTFRTARMLHASGVRLREPGATDRDVLDAWLQERLGNLPRPARQGSPMFLPGDELRVFQEVVDRFTTLNIPYALGGSLAASIHGYSRHTHDADVTVEPFPGKEEQLVAALGSGYYASLPTIRQAVRERCTFNLIHLETGFKVDVFVQKDLPFEQSAMARRLSTPPPEPGSAPIMVQTPEDLILFKLRWFRLGNEVSEKQWTDILAVMKVQSLRLDNAYLDHWAADLGTRYTPIRRLAIAKEHVLGLF